MTEDPRPQFALEDLAFLFQTLAQTDSACVLIGGQAASYWVQRFLPGEPVLQKLAQVTDFLSKDVDFQGDRTAVITLARGLGKQAEVPGFRDAFGNLLAGKFTLQTPKGRLTVEVLRKVPGLTPAEVARMSSVEPYGATKVRVLNPVAMLLAKAWNVRSINKEGRHDAEQLLALLPCVRAYLRGYFLAGRESKPVLRAALRLTERLLRFTELHAGRRTAEKCGVDWSQILPHACLAALAQPEVIHLREQRLPDWLRRLALHAPAVPENTTWHRMLEILAAHAEPLCAAPATSRCRPRLTITDSLQT
jgi:hypothetical protein